MTIDITIPVLNEEETLVEQVGILHTFLIQEMPDRSKWKIIIADNGSTDQTAERATQLSHTYPEVKLVVVPSKGVGLALKTSWMQSEADLVGYMDLDLATALTHFTEAYQKLTVEQYDLVYATRLHSDSIVINRPLKREIASRGFNRILKAYLGVVFSDGMCGFKFLHRKHLAPIMENGAQNDGWFFSTELLTVAEWLDLKLYELPVVWTDDTSSSRVKIVPLAKRYLKSMRALKQFGKAKGLL